MSGRDMTPTEIKNLAASTTAAGTRAQVSTSKIGCRWLRVEAKSGNTGVVYVGGSDVSSTVYTARLTAAAGVTLDIDRIDKVWYDVSISSEGIQAGYLA